MNETTIRAKIENSTQRSKNVVHSCGKFPESMEALAAISNLHDIAISLAEQLSKVNAEAK